MIDPHADLDPATLAVSLGRPPRRAGAPLNVPVELSSTFLGSATSGPGPVYGRTDNANWQALEHVIGTLEGAPNGCTVFGSGMAAVAAVLDLLDHGGLLVVPATAYNTTLELAGALRDRGRLRLAVADPADPAAVEQALEPGAMLWIESPSNPLLEVLDVPRLVGSARAAGAVSVVDNTFNTPLLATPLADGADVVVHSATKYLSGHSDLLLGAVVTGDAETHRRLVTTRRLTGGVPGPFEAWLALRGMRTLDVRLRRSVDTARLLAQRLTEHPRVDRVRYPGGGAVVSVEVAGGAAAADAVVDALRLWTPATSLGGVESLAERRRRHGNEPATVPESLIRLSVGVEHAGDLWRDLDQALRVTPGRGPIR